MQSNWMRLAVIGVVAVWLSACGRDELAAGECDSRRDCEAGESCVEGRCAIVEPPMPDPCQFDSECGDGLICGPGDFCVVGTCEGSPSSCGVDEDLKNCECVCIDGAGCEADTGCQTDADCEEPDYCILPEGVCGIDERPFPECLGDGDCAAQQRCEDELCVDRGECVVDDDCGDQELCLNAVCTAAPECETNEQCGDGFECIGGNCFTAICRGPDDCETGELCDGGECRVPPPAFSCFVATPSGTVTDGQRVPLEAFAVDEQGNGVAATFAWSSSEPGVAAIDAAGTTAVGGTAAGSTTITATLATGDPVVCEGEVVLTNPGPVAAGNVGVVVVHGETGAPVAGAEVVIGNQTATTDASGFTSLTAPSGDFEVSVFSDDFNFLTVQGVSATSIRLPLSPKAGSGPVAGFTGEFDTSMIHSQGDVTLGLAGASLAGGLLDLSLTALLGEPFMRTLTVPGQGSQELPLPAGMVAYGQVFGLNFDIKPDYYATSPGGARIGWGLAGKVPFNELMALQSANGSFGEVIAALLPLFNRFDHAARPLNLSASARVADTADIDRDGDTSELLPDYGSFPVVNLGPSVQQTLVTDVDISNFPALREGPAEVAVLLGSTLLASPGQVPLGISATSDEDGDGRPDTRRLSIAPPHGSLAGGRYAVVALAFRTDGGGLGGANGLELPTDLSASLWNGQSFPAQVSLGTFPDASEASVDNATRTITITNADAGPVFRARLVGEERSWDVWSVGPAGTQGSFAHSFTVPVPPSGRVDLLSGGGVILDAVQTNVDLDALVRASGVGLRNAGLVSSAFSRTTLR